MLLVCNPCRTCGLLYHGTGPFRSGLDAVAAVPNYFACSSRFIVHSQGSGDLAFPIGCMEYGRPRSRRRFRLSSAERKQEHKPSITPEERERLHDLCERLANEQDPKKFTNLVMELNQLLGSKEVRIEFHEKLK
jgi:hypothetical protein